MRVLHLCMAVGTWIALSCGQAATVEKSIGVTFPDQVAGLVFQDREEFPNKSAGVVLAYAGHDKSPLRAAIYIYDAGESTIPSGIDSPMLKRHFAQAISAVQQMERLGKVRNVTFIEKTTQSGTGNACAVQFIGQAYEMEIGGVNGPLLSATYLTAIRNRFVKLRVTYRKGDASGAMDVERFVQQVGLILGGCN